MNYETQMVKSFSEQESNESGQKNGVFSTDWLREEIYDFNKIGKGSTSAEPEAREPEPSTEAVPIEKDTQTDKINSENSESKIEGRFESAEIEKAIDLSREKNIPLVVQVGASWCGHCQNMEKNIWPQIEGKDGLPENAVILHLDYEKANEFTGRALELANKLKEGVEGFPTLKIYKPGLDGDPVVQHSGELSVESMKEFLKSGNVKI